MFEHRKVRDNGKSISVFPFGGAKSGPVSHLSAVGPGDKLLNISGLGLPHLYNGDDNDTTI